MTHASGTAAIPSRKKVNTRLFKFQAGRELPLKRADAERKDFGLVASKPSAKNAEGQLTSVHLEEHIVRRGKSYRTGVGG